MHITSYNYHFYHIPQNSLTIDGLWWFGGSISSIKFYKYPYTFLAENIPSPVGFHSARCQLKRCLGCFGHEVVEPGRDGRDGQWQWPKLWSWGPRCSKIPVPSSAGITKLRWLTFACGTGSMIHGQLRSRPRDSICHLAVRYAPRGLPK